MSLLLTDGFDCYGTGDITTVIGCRWGKEASLVTAVSGKERGNAISLGNVELLSRRQEDLVTLVIGFWFKTDNVSASTSSICGFRASTVDYVDIRLNSSGILIVTRDGTTIGTGTTALSINTWYFIDFKATINDTTGAADVHLNGQSEIGISNVDTQNGTDVFVNEFMLGSGISSGTATFDHLYCCDTSGSRLNDIIGPMEIETVKPDADGNSTDWTPLSGDNFENVDDVTPDGDATYNSTSTDTNKDTHSFTDSVHNGAKLAAANVVLARKDDVGDATYRNVTRIGGTDFTGSTVLAYDGYIYNTEFDELNPDTSAVWSKTDIDISEFGYERVS